MCSIHDEVREARKQQEQGITFESGGKSYRLRDRGVYGKKRSGVAFVSGADEHLDSAEAIQPAAAAVAAPTIYTRRGVFPTVDRAWDEFNRQVVAAQRAVLDDGLRALGHRPEEMGIQFSRTAGCSCPCSPGFVLRRMPFASLYIERV